MPQAPKIGFHLSGSGGNPTGINDDHLKRLDAAGIPVFIKTADGMAGLADALALPNPFGVNHIIVYRTSGDQYDVPDYTLEPSQAAALHWQKSVDRFPVEIKENKSRVWVEVINEVRKENDPSDAMYNNMDASDWLGWFGVAIAGLAMTDGYNIALFGWSSGEPEPDDWLQVGMLQFLQIAAANPTRVAVALHEYSYDIDDIMAQYPYLIGRYKFLHDACDVSGIARPTILITEWGWTLNDVPSDPIDALSDIDTICEEYARHPNILGAAIWYLGGGFGDIANKAQKLIAPVTDFMLVTEYPDVGQPEPPSEEFMKIKRDAIISYILPQVGNKLTISERYWDKELKRQVVIRSHQIDIGEDTSNLYFRVIGDIPCEAGPPENPNPPQALKINFKDLGIDISAHQGNNFTWDLAIANGVKFAMIRSSNGMGSGTTDSNGRDTALLTNAAKLTQLGIPWAIYHYLRPDHDIQAQIALVKDILDELKSLGTYPLTGEFEDATFMPAVWIDVERADIINQMVLDFYNGIAADETCGIYTSTKYWNPITAGLPNWWEDIPFWLAAYGVNDGTLPNWTAPTMPNGKDDILIWQYTSVGQDEVGWTGSGLDLDSAGIWQPNTPLPPLQTSNPAVGLHASADPGEVFDPATGNFAFYGGEAEFAEFRTLNGGVIKILSAHGENAIRRLESENKGVEWIVRAFLDFGDRNITPEQFFNDTVSDTERAVNALVSQGVPQSKIWIELHNEPNLVQEGLGASWADGLAFSRWLDDVLTLYRVRLPDVQYIYPGLSPGWTVDGVRQDSGSFWEQSLLSVINKLDGIGAHAYWSKDFDIQLAVDEVSKYQNYNMPLWVTEASINDRPALATTDYGTEYYDFVQRLKVLKNVRGVTYFVASASNSLFWPECFIVEGQSKGWAARINQLNGG